MISPSLSIPPPLAFSHRKVTDAPTPNPCVRVFQSATMVDDG